MDEAKKDIYHVRLYKYVSDAIIHIRANEAEEFEFSITFQFGYRDKKGREKGGYIYYHYKGDVYCICKIFRLWVARLWFDHRQILVELYGQKARNFLVIKYDPLYNAIHQAINRTPFDVRFHDEFCLVNKNKKRLVQISNTDILFGRITELNEMFHIYVYEYMAREFFFKFVFEPFSKLHLCSIEYSSSYCGILVKLITDGLANNGTFGKFLKLGLYDPRLFIFIWTFIS